MVHGVCACTARLRQQALYRGYANAGGDLDEGRLAVWFIVDKLSAAIYLYWKLHISRHSISPDQVEQYRADLKNLLSSLEKI